MNIVEGEFMGLFENISFIATILIGILLNITNSVLVIRFKTISKKIIFALLPFPIVFIILILNSIILNIAISITGSNSDYGGYGTGLAVISGLIMVPFYIANGIILFIYIIKELSKNDNK